jgi:hypothetical protein
MALPVIGAVAGGLGLVGGLANMFRGSPQFNAPTLDSLRRQNPELYNALMDIRRQSAVYEQMASQRQGVSPLQRQMMADQGSQINQQMANRGLVGSSAGTQMQADARSRMMNQALQQAFQERQALMGASQGANQAFLGGFGQAVAPQMQQEMARYQQEMGNRQAQNQFFSGLVGGGLNLYGTDMMLNRRLPVEYP